MIFTTLLAIALGAAASGPSSAAQSAQNFNWQRFSGTTLRVMLNSHPWQKFIQPLIPQFEKQTGIHVQLEVYPEDQFRQKLLLDLSARSSAVDAFMFMPAQNLALYRKEGWLAPLNSYLDNPAMTAPDLAYDDFFKGVRDRYDVGESSTGSPSMSRPSSCSTARTSSRSTACIRPRRCSNSRRWPRPSRRIWLRAATRASSRS